MKTLQLVLILLLCSSLAQPSRLWNGTTDCLHVASAPALDNNNTALTICAWVYVSGTDGSGYANIFWKGTGSGLTVLRVGPTLRLEMIRLYVINPLTYSVNNTVPTLNTAWLFVCGSWASGDGGNRIWTGSAGGTVTQVSYTTRDPEGGVIVDDSGDGIYIGCRGTGVETMNGAIAEVRYFNVVLTAAEMTSLLRGYPVRPGNQLAYYPLQGRASPEPDRGPNGYNLTVSGTVTTGGPPPIAPSFGWFNLAKILRLQMPWLG